LLAFAAVLTAATILCILFVDRPVAIYVARHQAWRLVFQAMASPSLLALPAAAVFLVVTMFRGLKRVSRLGLAMSMAVLAGTAAKDELKWMFGRPWPDTWLETGHYAFVPFINSEAYGAFPSGHATYISAPLCVLFALAPRYRLLCVAVIGGVMLGLVAANYHFVGDVLGGLLTGMFCAWGSVMLVRRND
jgi:membrane-associated phospholipid phosphatase